MLQKSSTRDAFKHIVTKAKIARKSKTGRSQNVGYSLLMNRTQKRNKPKCQTFIMKQLIGLSIKNKSLMETLLETKQVRLQMEQMIGEMQDMQMSLTMRLNSMHLELVKSRKDLKDAVDEKSKLLNLLKNVKNMLTDPILADEQTQQLNTSKRLRTPDLNSEETKKKLLPVTELPVKNPKKNLEGDVFHNFQHSSSKLKRVKAENRISSAWSEVSFDPDTAIFDLDELSGEDNNLSSPEYEGMPTNKSKGIKRLSDSEDSDLKLFEEKRHCQSLGNNSAPYAELNEPRQRNCRLNTKSLPISNTSESTFVESNTKADCIGHNIKKKKRGILRPTNENLPFQKSNLNDAADGIRSRRNKGAVCYKEPSLTKKLRREIQKEEESVTIKKSVAKTKNLYAKGKREKHDLICVF